MSGDQHEGGFRVSLSVQPLVTLSVYCGLTSDLFVGFGQVSSHPALTPWNNS